MKPEHCAQCKCELTGRGNGNLRYCPECCKKRSEHRERKRAKKNDLNRTTQRKRRAQMEVL